MGVWMKLLRSLTKPPKGRSPSNRAPTPERHKDLRKGFYWNGADVTALAAGQGFNQIVVGESFYRDNLERLTGGPTQFGVDVSVAVTLREGVYEGRPTVEAYVGGLRCGSIPSADADAILYEMQPLTALGKPLVAKGKISAGYVGGDYSVTLSLARPLKVRKA